MGLENEPTVCACQLTCTTYSLRPKEIVPLPILLCPKKNSPISKKRYNLVYYKGGTNK